MRRAAAQDGQLEHNIGRMRYVTMDLLIKLSRSFQQKRLAVIFLVVNLNHVAQARTWRAACPHPPHHPGTSMCQSSRTSRSRASTAVTN